GGGISSEASLSVIRSKISLNALTGGDAGNGGTSAPAGAGGDGGDGGDAQGGGAFHVGALTTSDSTIINNTTVAGDGGMGAAVGGTNGAPGTASGANLFP